MLHITGTISLPPSEIEYSYTTSQGPGGQNVNKVATTVILRFDIRASSLPEPVKQRLLSLDDRRITADGVVVIRAGRHRTREQNRRSAQHRLQELIGAALATRARRIKTRPTRSSREKRLQKKTRRSRIKALRSRISE